MSFDDLQGGPFESDYKARRVTDRPKVKINVNKSTSVTFYGSIKLDELREFVTACRGLSGTATVNITKYAGHQLDGSSTTITVNDA